MGFKHVSLAKTTRPSLSGVLPRERLFERLDQARRSPIIWITGPPGSGKTTLAASYLLHCKLPSLWYQIDESDMDVASFFYHLGLATADHARIKGARLPQLTPQHHSGLSAFARRYFQALYRNLGASFAIVFDGYHEVSPQSTLHDIMLVALSEVPAGGSVVLISRRDPPAGMARLRANRTLDVVGWRDLRLTQEELDGIAAQRGRSLSEAALVELYRKTQGWAAGLILMLEQAEAGSLAAPSDLSTPQLVFDYLAGEIFQKTDSGTQELLLSTAYLPQMTADMARTLSGQDDAGERLANMYSNNYFVTLKPGHPQPIYEYHPLLREFVLARANAALNKERRQQLQRASAELLESEGLLSEAVVLLRAISDWERIGTVIRRHARILLDSGRSETLAQWVESLPKDVQEQNPWTLYWLAVARMHVSPRESRLLHERAFALFNREREPDVRGLLFTCSGAMDAILYEVDDFSLLDRWIAVMDRLLREHPGLISGASEARITCSLFTSMVLRQPHHPEIEHWADRAYRASLAQPDVNVRMSVEPRVALGIAWGGHFPRAWAVIEGIHRLIEQHEVPPLALTMLKLVEATYFMLTAQREPCLQVVREGLEIERFEGVNVLSHQLLAYGAGGALAANDLDTAETFLNESDALPGIPARFDLCLYHLFSTWLAMRRHDPVRAFQQQKLALRMAVEVGCPVFEVLCRIASAHVQYEGGEQRAAMAQFQQVYDTAKRIRNHLLEFTGLMAYAYVALEGGRRPRSGMWALRQALAVAKPRNYTSFLLWRPDPLARLCSVALETGTEPEFVAKLIRARGLALDATSAALLDWPWPLRVNTLGPFRVLKNGSAIAFSGKAQRRPLDLLKALIAYGGKEVNEERITEALWPRIDGDSAHRSFTTTLHRLRKLLGEDRAIHLSEGKLTLDGRYVWVDTWAFEQVIERINQALRAPPELTDPDRIDELAERLFKLYRGAFLGNEPDESWSLPLRDRERHRFMRAVGDLCHYWQQTSRPERAVDILERALELDNAAEGLYRNLMVCYVQMGRRADAAETYDRCRKMLAASLKIAPSPETSAIYDELSRPT
jgi:LuxR family maltose regulon positive regulatory protein